MATGGVFKLVANDGKADRMLLATALLRQRILDIFNARKHAGKADLTPTLVDIERTHILYVNAHFKPFAAIGYEYSKIKPQSGTPLFGSSVVFSIPQYGDFFYDIVVRTKISAGSAQAYTAQTLTSYTFTDIYGTSAPSTVQNFVRYCEYPGYRLFNKVSFEVNGNPLDAYDTDTIVMLGKFTVPVNKQDGNSKLNGQQVSTPGLTSLTFGTYIDSDAANTPLNTIGAWNAGQSANQVAPFKATGALNATSDQYNITSVETTNLNPTAPVNVYATGTQIDFFQKEIPIVNGPQVPKPTQPPLELWTKLRFWFNDDVRLAVPSVSIPFGQRFINMEICNATDLLFQYPTAYYYLTAGINNAYPTSPVYYLGELATSYNVQNMEMYINNIFVNPEIHDIYIRRIGFSLIRVYRKQSGQVNTDNGNVLLSSLKWPIEYLWVGFRPKYNTTAPLNTTPTGYTAATWLTYNGNWNMWHDWWQMTRQIPITVVGSTLLSGTPTTANAGMINGDVAQGTAVTTNARLAQDVTYFQSVTTVNTLGLVSHGIPIYAEGTYDTFFNEYLPYNYGGLNLNTPKDTGAYFINFALFPRSYQPSGHLNISRARETYLYWTSTYISGNTPCNLVCIAVAINFLLITDGSAILRYST